MDNQIITERLKQYRLNTLEDEENALKEILQQIALYALSTTDFFSKALFQGGTSLRILYGLPRFSEDLDFLLNNPNPHFQWEKYITKIEDVFKLYGIKPEIKDRSKAGSVIQKLFLKDHSIGKILNLNFHHHTQRKLLIKLEIDTNPPLGSHDEINYLDFPIDYAVVTQDLASNFAGKCHALLCRDYTKGRDWFDFTWYVARNTKINFNFLENAIHQQGPWKDQQIKVNKDWLINQLEHKVMQIDWKKAKEEVQRFINLDHAATLNVWNQAFFLNRVHKLKTS